MPVAALATRREPPSRRRGPRCRPHRSRPGGPSHALDGAAADPPRGQPCEPPRLRAIPGVRCLGSVSWSPGCFLSPASARLAGTGGQRSYRTTKRSHLQGNGAPGGSKEPRSHTQEVLGAWRETAATHWPGVQPGRGYTWLPLSRRSTRSLLRANGGATKFRALRCSRSNISHHSSDNLREKRPCS